MNAVVRLPLPSRDRIDAAEAGFRTLMRERLEHPDVENDLLALDCMAAVIREAVAQLGEIHRRLDGAKVVPFGHGWRTARFDPQAAEQALCDAMGMAPEAQAVLEARLDR